MLAASWVRRGPSTANAIVAVSSVLRAWAVMQYFRRHRKLAPLWLRSVGNQPKKRRNRATRGTHGGEEHRTRHVMCKGVLVQASEHIRGNRPTRRNGVQALQRPAATSPTRKLAEGRAGHHLPHARSGSRRGAPTPLLLEAWPKCALHPRLHLRPRSRGRSPSDHRRLDFCGSPRPMQVTCQRLSAPRRCEYRQCAHPRRGPGILDHSTETRQLRAPTVPCLRCEAELNHSSSALRTLGPRPAHLVEVKKGCPRQRAEKDPAHMCVYVHGLRGVCVCAEWSWMASCPEPPPSGELIVNSSWRGPVAHGAGTQHRPS